MIAIVDDDPGMREAIEGLVQSLGHEPRCFASAADFLADPMHNEMKCVILDIRMPGMDGLELQAILNREGRSPPVIILSSYADGPMGARATAQGARCILAKPVDDVALIDCLGRVLSE